MTDHTPNSKVSRLEVVSTGARRRWTLEEKQRIIAESYGGPRLVSVTARRNGLSAGQLFTWRRLAREGRLHGMGSRDCHRPHRHAPWHAKPGSYGSREFKARSSHWRSLHLPAAP